MMHNLRVIKLTEGPHIDEKIKLWHDESSGYCDGETLVIETTNFSDKSTFGHNRSRINIKLFMRISEHKMLYSRTADQPDT